MSELPVVVVGAGVSGAACARALAARGIPVEVRERSQVVGGRMASRTTSGRLIDHGASYFTATDPAFRAVVADWEERGLARPWTDRFHAWERGVLVPPRTGGPVRWSAPRGLRSLVADLLSPVVVRHEAPVSRVAPGPTVDGSPVRAVVLAMPDPQAARLLAPELVAHAAATAGRAWEPVLALLARYERRSWSPDLDGAFVNGHPVLSWIADDGRRRGDGAAVLVAHSTAAFATPRLETPEAAEAELVAAVRATLGVAEPPAHAEVHRWTFARPASPRAEPFFLAAGIGLCGDGWGEPRVETAWRSGDALGRALGESLAPR